MKDNKKETIEEKVVVKCQMCIKRDAVTTAVKPFTGETIEVCGKCFNDIIDEEDE